MVAAPLRRLLPINYRCVSSMRYGISRTIPVDTSHTRFRSFASQEATAARTFVGNIRLVPGGFRLEAQAWRTETNGALCREQTTANGLSMLGRDLDPKPYKYRAYKIGRASCRERV